MGGLAEFCAGMRRLPEWDVCRNQSKERFFIMAEDKRIAVGSDHAAAEVKDRLVAYLRDLGWEVRDFTKLVDGKADYPDAAHQVARVVAKGDFPKGLLLCGTGLGMSYTANRYPGVRAALCLDEEFAKLSREHNDANILVMPGRAKIYAPPERILDAWLNTPFSGDARHMKRIEKIEMLPADFLACDGSRKSPAAAEANAAGDDDIFLHGKEHDYTYDEYCKIVDLAIAADDRGDVDEYNRIALSLPLHPVIAKKMKLFKGKDYLLEIGADLTEANLVFGEGWLDAAED